MRCSRAGQQELLVDAHSHAEDRCNSRASAVPAAYVPTSPSAGGYSPTHTAQRDLHIPPHRTCTQRLPRRRRRPGPVAATRRPASAVKRTPLTAAAWLRSRRLVIDAQHATALKHHHFLSRSDVPGAIAPRGVQDQRGRETRVGLGAGGETPRSACAKPTSLSWRAMPHPSKRSPGASRYPTGQCATALVVAIAKLKQVRHAWNRTVSPRDRGDTTPGREPDPMFHAGSRIPPDSPQRGIGNAKADE